MAERLFRGLVNRIHRRSNFREENLDLNGVARLLHSLGDISLRRKNIEGKLNYYHPTAKIFGESVQPMKAMDFVSRVFKPKEGFPFFSYFESTHQVYSGDKNEKHYFDLVMGAMEIKYGKSVKTQMRRAKIEFILEH